MPFQEDDTCRMYRRVSKMARRIAFIMDSNDEHYPVAVAAIVMDYGKDEAATLLEYVKREEGDRKAGRVKSLKESMINACKFFKHKAECRANVLAALWLRRN